MAQSLPTPQRQSLQQFMPRTELTMQQAVRAPSAAMQNQGPIVVGRGLSQQQQLADLIQGQASTVPQGMNGVMPQGWFQSVFGQSGLLQAGGGSRTTGISVNGHESAFNDPSTWLLDPVRPEQEYMAAPPRSEWDVDPEDVIGFVPPGWCECWLRIRYFVADGIDMGKVIKAIKSSVGRWFKKNICLSFEFQGKLGKEWVSIYDTPPRQRPPGWPPADDRTIDDLAAHVGTQSSAVAFVGSTYQRGAASSFTAGLTNMVGGHVSAVKTATSDPSRVLDHELGHQLGLGEGEDAVTTDNNSNLEATKPENVARMRSRCKQRA